MRALLEPVHHAREGVAPLGIVHALCPLRNEPGHRPAAAKDAITFAALFHLSEKAREFLIGPGNGDAFHGCPDRKPRY